MDFRILLLALGCFTRSSSGQLPPVTLRVDRNWVVSPSASVGTLVARVQHEYTSGPPLLFGLETSGPPVPFAIDPRSGIVTVNDTLIDKANKTYLLWVTASNGDFPNSKLEVQASITDSGFRQRPPRPPAFLDPNFKLPPFPDRSPAADSEKVREIVHESVEVKDEQTLSAAPTSLRPPKPPEDVNKNWTYTVEGGDGNGTTTISVRSDGELGGFLIPLMAGAALLAVAGVVGALLWRRGVTNRSKSQKEDMAKESNGGIVLQDASFHTWDRPRAFSNRYESWDNSHLQLAGDATPDEDTKSEPRDRWELPRHRLRVFNIVGEGAFGQVWRAQAIDLDGHKGEVTVAVKTLKENASEKEKSDLLQELDVMKSLGTHPNVVRLLACCTDKEPTFVIMEFVALGKLQSFLRESRAERHYGNTHGGSRSLTSRDLTHFAYQVARGMHFLSENGIIHRDLAARNVLINEDRTCKVADFGFARDVTGTHVYERKSDGRLPIRWMAPESLYDDIFSAKSDIWSFGVLVWEIVTLGSTPYPGLSAGDVMRKVREGYRLEKPEHCRRELYNIMYYCWEAEPHGRPDFEECVSLLERLLCTETDYIELERFPDHSYYNVQHLDGEKL